MVQLRVLTADDWPMWRDARLAALTEAPHAFKSRLTDWHQGGKERWRARLETSGTYNLAALLSDRTVGIASGLPGQDGTYELRSIWVSPQVRGHGIGDQLIAAVETWARRSGATVLKLAVIPGNEPAIALYRRRGFTSTENPGDLLPDGTTREQVMIKALG